MIKYGSYYTIFKSLGLNIYFGLGMQKTTYSYFNILNPINVNIESYKHGYKNFIDEGSSINLEFTLGIKLFIAS